MENDTNSLLFDIVEGCLRIEEFTASIDFAEYESSDLIRSAVERQFINIGEAINRLKGVDEEAYSAIPDASRIEAFRNVLVHGYDVVSNELVWEVINEKLNELRDTCKSFLDK